MRIWKFYKSAEVKLKETSFCLHLGGEVCSVHIGGILTAAEPQ